MPAPSQVWTGMASVFIVRWEWASEYHKVDYKVKELPRNLAEKYGEK